MPTIRYEGDQVCRRPCARNHEPHDLHRAPGRRDVHVGFPDPVDVVKFVAVHMVVLRLDGVLQGRSDGLHTFFHVRENVLGLILGVVPVIREFRIFSHRDAGLGIRGGACPNETGTDRPSPRGSNAPKALDNRGEKRLPSGSSCRESRRSHKPERAPPGGCAHRPLQSPCGPGDPGGTIPAKPLPSREAIQPRSGTLPS